MKVWETKGQYHTLESLCQYTYHPLLGDSMYAEAGTDPPYNGFEALKEWPTLRKLAIEKLNELGFRRFAYIGHGDFAIVLKTVENQVVRISVDSEENKRLIHPAILQPYITYLIHDKSEARSPTLRLEVLTQIKDLDGHTQPEISIENITEEHVNILKKILRKSGLFPLDLSIKNIALLTDGTPVVIDGGAVTLQSDMKMSMDENILQDWLVVDKYGIKTWKQYAFHPEIEKGEVHGTLKPADIEMLRRESGEDSQLYLAALEDGLYRAELGQLIINASAAHQKILEAGGADNFRETLRAERKKIDKISGPDNDWPKIR